MVGQTIVLIISALDSSMVLQLLPKDVLKILGQSVRDDSNLGKLHRSY